MPAEKTSTIVGHRIERSIANGPFVIFRREEDGAQVGVRVSPELLTDPMLDAAALARPIAEDYFNNLGARGRRP